MTDWNDEETEVLQLTNRIRQLVSKVNREGYKTWAADEGGPMSVSCGVGGFNFYILRSGQVYIFKDTPGKDTGTKLVFNANFVGSKLCHEWEEGIVRNEVIPLIDQEMVLDDLSLLG